MAQFIHAANGDLVNTDDIVIVCQTELTVRDQGRVEVSAGTAQRLDELTGAFHPNHQPDLFLLEEYGAGEGYYLRLRIIGWIRCPGGETLPVTPHGPCPLVDATFSPSYAILDVRQGIVFTNCPDVPEAEPLPLHVWEARTGLRPYCPPDQQDLLA